MSEESTVIDAANAAEAGTTQIDEGGTEARTFTQEEVNKLVGDARKKERSKYEDYNALKDLAEKSSDYEKQLQAAIARAEAAEKEAQSLKDKDARSELVKQQATEAGVDAELLAMMVGNTKEEIAANAEVLKSKISALPIYPTIPDNGSSTSSPMTKEEILAIKNQKERIKAISENAHLFK